jgi:hypothetical protein
VAYPILSAAFDADELQMQFRRNDVLPLSYSDDDQQYVIPTNPLLAQRILREVSAEEQSTMFDVYCALGARLAPYVNRDAVRRRTPEARLAGRLFDYDDVVSEFIPNGSEDFYLRMQRYWDWNSRYWEQFALLKLDRFITSNKPDRFDLLSQAISHAKHALRLERHPLGLTTLGRILFEEMMEAPARFETSFKEAFGYLQEAIQQEGTMNRLAIQPYMTLFSGTYKYIKQSGAMSVRQLEQLRSHMENAETLFGYDKKLMSLVGDVRRRIGEK